MRLMSSWQRLSRSGVCLVSAPLDSGPGAWAPPRLRVSDPFKSILPISHTAQISIDYDCCSPRTAFE